MDFQYTETKSPALWPGFLVFHGAEGETRTLMPKRQNLNLVRLPISPLPLRGLGFHHLIKMTPTW